jgi:hypothetical protein
MIKGQDSITAACFLHTFFHVVLVNVPPVHVSPSFIIRRPSAGPGHQAPGHRQNKLAGVYRLTAMQTAPVGTEHVFIIRLGVVTVEQSAHVSHEENGRHSRCAA